MDIGAWLRKLGLERYEPAFRENKIDSEILPRLTAEDLKDLGVVLVGERRRLMEAIAALRAEHPTAATPDSSSIERQPPASSAGPAAAQSVASAAVERPLPGERRHLTVVFCDLVGSTEVAAQLDLEDWRDIVADYHRAVADAVVRFGGHVAKNLGDGALIYFGYPQAQENDAERAVRAGLAILELIAAQSLALKARGLPELAVRVGIHAGPVVIGEDGEVYGEAANIASRVQEAAEPSVVLITSAVHRSLSGLVVVNERGLHALKGVAGPIGLFQVVRFSGAGRWRTTHAVAPLIGREEELRQLESRWARARAGRGQLVFVVGEAGLGKSRLAQEFQGRLADVPHTWSEFACSQLLQNTPFHPVVEAVKRRLEEQEATAERRLEALAAWHRAVGLDPAQSVPLVAPLLELPVPAEYRPPAASPEEQRRRLIATLAAWITGGARTQAVVLQVEDVHWADPSTLDLLRVLAEQGAAVPLMLLITSRPEFRTPWPHRSHHAVVALAPLDPHEVQRMVNGVAAHHKLSGQTIETLVMRTGGVPLFIEELTRLMLENGGQDVTQAIPSSLQALLTARLDRLGPAKEVAQVAAVLGSEFTYPLIRAVTGQSDVTLTEALDRLAEADLIHVLGIPPESSYRFKHVLMREAAYEAVLKSRRRELHHAVARVIQERFPRSEPEVLAHHLTEAGLYEQAVVCWQTAGESAMHRSANVEAVSHLTTARKLLMGLRPAAGRTQQELTLLLALGAALTVTKGWATPEAEDVYTRARVLCQEGGETGQLFPVLLASHRFYALRGELQLAHQVGEQLLQLAERADDPTFLLPAHVAYGYNCFFRGDLILAKEHLEKGISYYDAQQHGFWLSRWGEDPGIVALGFGALTLWSLGFPDQALARSSEELALASKTTHPFSLAFSLWIAARLHQVRREVTAVEERVDRMMALSTEQGFLAWLGHGMILRGWTMCMRGDAEEGIAQMLEGLAAERGAGANLHRTHYLALLAEAYGASRKHEEGLATIGDAFAMADKTGEGYSEAELHRVKGVLLQQTRRDEREVEACFRRAIDGARARSAKSLELRAAANLASLWQGRGKKAEARQMLGEIYGGFSEGFETADLQEAKALLEKLA